MMNLDLLTFACLPFVNVFQVLQFGILFAKLLQSSCPCSSMDDLASNLQALGDKGITLYRYPHSERTKNTSWWWLDYRVDLELPFQVSWQYDMDSWCFWSLIHIQDQLIWCFINIKFLCVNLWGWRGVFIPQNPPAIWPPTLGEVNNGKLPISQNWNAAAAARKKGSIDPFPAIFWRSALLQTSRKLSPLRFDMRWVQNGVRMRKLWPSEVAPKIHIFKPEN
jgi:hypothetical protein